MCALSKSQWVGEDKLRVEFPPVVAARLGEQQAAGRRSAPREPSKQQWHWGLGSPRAALAAAAAARAPRALKAAVALRVWVLGSQVWIGLAGLRSTLLAFR